MAWILVMAGVLVTGGGLWLLARSPAPSEAAAEVEAVAARSKAVGETPWDVLMSPVEATDHSKSGKRAVGPFRMGLLIGIGFGVIVTGALWATLGNGTPSKDDLVRMAKEKYNLVLAPTTGTSTATTATTGATSTANSGTKSTTTTTTPPATADKSVTIEVVSGDLWDTVGQKLKDAGLIKDKAAFVAKVTEMQADSNLQLGSFPLSPSMTVEEMINKLQGK